MKIRIPSTRITGIFDGKLYKDVASGKVAKSPSGFARLAFPNDKSLNGWKILEYQDNQGRWQLLDKLREEKQMQSKYPMFEDSYLKSFY